MRARRDHLRVWINRKICTVSILGAALPTSAWAADPAPTEAGVLRTETEAGEKVVPPASVEPRFAGQLSWARWMLADLPPAQQDDRTRISANLPVTELRADVWQVRAESARSAVSAIGSVAAGLPLLKIWRDGKLRSRHFLRAFFRSSGASLAWRIEF